jgi:hypothetical protein
LTFAFLHGLESGKTEVCSTAAFNVSATEHFSHTSTAFWTALNFPFLKLSGKKWVEIIFRAWGVQMLKQSAACADRDGTFWTDDGRRPG